MIVTDYEFLPGDAVWAVYQDEDDGNEYTAYLARDVDGVWEVADCDDYLDTCGVDLVALLDGYIRAEHDRMVLEGDYD